MNTYTVTTADGTVLDRGLNAVDAMAKVLNDDGYAFEIRPAEDGEGYELWHSDGSAASCRGAGHMVKTVAYSLKSDEAEATAEIAEIVINAGWPRLPEVMTDADYDAMLAEADNE